MMIHTTGDRGENEDDDDPLYGSARRYCHNEFSISNTKYQILNPNF